MDVLSVPLPTALGVAALAQWSLPSIQAILRLFPGMSSRFASLAPANSAIQECLFRLLDSPPDNPGRIIKIYNWIGAYGSPVTSSFPIIQHIKSRTLPGYIAKLVIEIDIPHVANVAASESASEADACQYMPVKHILRHLSEQFDQELLDLVLERDWMDQYHWARLLASIERAPSSTKFWWEKIQALVDDQEDRKAIVSQALRSAATQGKPVQAFRLVCILRTEFGVDPLGKMLHNLDNVDPFDSIQLIASLDLAALPDPRHILSELVSILASADTIPSNGDDRCTHWT